MRGGLAGHLGDGLAMSVAAGGAALVGMLSWILVARALTPAELGTATAFVSAFLLVAGCTEFNVGIGLLRWLPRTGGAAGGLLLRAGVVIAGAAAVVAACYLLLPDTSIIVDAVVGRGGDHRLLGAGIFVVAAVLYALFQQQDYVLVGLGRAWWAPARTAVFAVGRLGILVVAGASLTTELVVASWVVPTAACVLLVGIQATILVKRTRDEPRWRPARREVVGFLAGAYAGQVATSVLFNQVPLLVTFRFGPEQGAAFFLVWQAVTVVDVVCLYFVAPLSAVSRGSPSGPPSSPRRRGGGCSASSCPPSPSVSCSPGRCCRCSVTSYATEANVLRVMLLGLAMRLLVVHRLGEHQAFGRGVRFGRLRSRTPCSSWGSRSRCRPRPPTRC